LFQILFDKICSEITVISTGLIAIITQNSAEFTGLFNKSALVSVKFGVIYRYERFDRETKLINDKMPQSLRMCPSLKDMSFR
jgi:hypothetical protein